MLLFGTMMPLDGITARLNYLAFFWVSSIVFVAYYATLIVGVLIALLVESVIGWLMGPA